MAEWALNSWERLSESVFLKMVRAVEGVCMCVCVCVSVCGYVCAIEVCVCVCVFIQSLNRVRLSETPCAVACQPPLSLGYFRQEYCRGLLFPPGDLPDPGMEP